MLLIQEGRFRLLRDDGRGLTLALSPSAKIEPQDLPPLLHRRVSVEWDPVPGLVAGKVHRVEPL